MNIIIAGCGKVGSALAEQLSKEGHDITVIDQSSSVVQKLTNAADVIGVVGNSASYSVLKDAGIESADLLIAVTNADEVNLLCCLIARKAGQCQTIARVRNPIYHQEINYLKEEMGLSVIINPEWAAAQEAARLLRFPSAIEIDTFAQGRIELLKFRLNANHPICHKKIKHIEELNRCEVLICIVERGNEVLIPGGDLELQPDDIVSIVASSVNASRFFRLIGIQTNQVKNTMIIGGSKTSYYLANKLLEMGISVKIVEKSRTACEELCELLPEAMIICGDGTDQDLMEEEGLREAEGFVSFTGIDEENIMMSLSAKNASRAKVITKVNSNTYDTILATLDIGSVIHPKHITSEYILQYVRAMQNSIGSNVETLYRLVGGRVEALEFLIHENSAATEKPLLELELKPNLLVGAIHRNGKIIIPKGQDCLKVGDSVVIITTGCSGMDGIDDILKDHSSGSAPRQSRMETLL